jgi:CelD/BcsL family acetyltransferase involved in cellulose biosynthesis
VRRHTDWSTSAFELRPIAEATGPFAHRPFLEAAGAHNGELFETDDALAVLAMVGGTVQFAGEADLTDYHTPLGTGVEGLFCDVASSGIASAFDLDSLPIEAAEPVAKGLERGGARVEMEQHTVAAVLDLPDTFDDYLSNIGKKQRHEVRRKHRRYEESVGELIYETHSEPCQALEEFFRLHRMSGGAKGTFMTEDHERFFRRLIEQPGWRIDVLRIPGEQRAAAGLFLFVDEVGMYLYNSAYDPGLSEASPGVAIIGAAIERAIGENLEKFDFLKGDEVYKFRLGAEERPLYRVRVTP